MNVAPFTFGGLHGDEIELFRVHLAGMVGRGVEIGCLDGFSTAHILEFSRLHLTSIDPIVPDSMESSLVGDPARLMANLAPYGARSTFIRDFSQNVARDPAHALLRSTPLDFLFIDGDHTYDAVLGDYTDWSPLLKVGGLLAIHDSRMSRKGGAKFHVGPSKVAAEKVYGNPTEWEIAGEAFSLTLARKLQ